MSPRNTCIVTRTAIVALAALAAPAGCGLGEPHFTPPPDMPPDTATVTAAVTSYDFGTVVIGHASAPATLTFTNTGATRTPELAQATLSGTGAVLFALGTDGCAGRTLAPGESCTVDAMMSPSSEGTGSAMLVVAPAQAGGAMVALSGKAVTAGALALTPTSTTYTALAPGGVSADAVFTATNNGGSPTGTITVTLSGSDASQFAIASDSCSSATLAPGGACTLKVRFAPRSPGGKAASLTAASVAAGTGVASLGGHAFLPAVLAITPTSSDFGAVVTGGISATTQFTVSNTGELPTGPVSTHLGGDTAGEYQVVSDGCAGRALAPAASCAIVVAFAPISPGMKPVQLDASASPGGTASSALSGTGIPPAALAFTPASNSYGTVDVGTTASATFALTNTGGQTSSTIATSLSGASAGEFAITSDGCNDRMLAPGASCNLVVAFTPASFGSKSATLQATAGVGGTTTASLSGSGRDKVTVTVSNTGGSGTGQVTCNQAACAPQYYRGTPITFTAIPDTNMIFGGWSGACAGTQTTCTVTLAGNTTVTAAFLPATQDLMLATSGLGGASGTITTAPPGASCGTGCVRFATGTQVTLTASPASGYYLSAWTGDCLGNGLTCQLAMTAGHAAAAQYAPANRAFVTSGTFWPDAANPGAWADATCQSVAQGAGLPGHYVGWLDNVPAAWSARLGNGSGWLRTDGKPFAASKTQLLAWHSLYPLDVDEHGTAWPVDTLVLSGSNGANCTNWTVTDPNAIYASGQAGGGWQQAAWLLWVGYGACGTRAHLYCFGTDYNVNLTYPRATGRIAFAATTATRGGLASMDNLCATRATAAGLTGTYRALAATTTTSAASRFSTAGSPWVRTDGIPIVAAAADLFNPARPVMTAALDIDETQGVAQNASSTFVVAVGAPDLLSAGTSASTCANWTDSTTQSGLSYGQSSFSNGLMAHAGEIPCSWPMGVYCLQQ